LQYSSISRHQPINAQALPHRKNLPDRPQLKAETSDEETASKAEAPQKSKLSRNGKGKRRIGWAALLKRTFEIDVLRCARCSGRMASAVITTATSFIHQRSGAAVANRRKSDNF
jgi:hypothetical protein